MRIGHGYDAHKLVPDRKLILGGVEIPYKFGLLGHSDADVLLHAIADSLLGAAGLGDIGKYFPDSDQRFKNINSLEILCQITQILLKKNYKIMNIDSTIIAQKPKIFPYISMMRENISKACKININCVNIKGTTEEKMGFTGRMEGISAHAVSLIE